MITFQGKKINILGKAKKIGEQAPNFYILQNDNKKVYLSDFVNPYILLNVVPSLETTICDLQTKKIDQKLKDFKNILILTISTDLISAQQKWCQKNILNQNNIVVSDEPNFDFAYKYGVLMELPDKKLLARSVFVLDHSRKIIYLEYVSEITNHPNYDELFNFLIKL